jgi:hypothetical protein
MSQVGQLGSGGIVLDQPSVALPPNVFSNGRNVRFRDEAVESITGEVVEVPHDPTKGVLYGFHWRTTAGGYNCYFRKNGASDAPDVLEVRLPDGRISVSFDQPKLGYWDHTLFNGGYSAVINNGVSVPKYLSLVDGVAAIQELPGWNYTEGISVTARIVRSFGYSLLAANLSVVDEMGVKTEYPSTIRISDQAAPGSIPQTWEPSLSSDTADEFDLATTSPITNALELRGSMFIYTFDSIHILQLAQNGTVTRRPYVSNYGCLNPRCCVEVSGRHFVVDRNDIYMHAGQGAPESIIDGRNREYFLENLDRAAENKVFLVRNLRMKEIWVCFPTKGSARCNEALVFNYSNNTWSIRDLPEISYAFPAPASDFSNVGGGTIDADGNWSVAKFNYLDERVNMTSTHPNFGGVFRADTGSLMWDGDEFVAVPSFLEKAKLNAGDFQQSVALSGIAFTMDRIHRDSLVEVIVIAQNDFVRDPDFSIAEPTSKRQLDPADPESFRIVGREQGRCQSFRLQSRDPWRLSFVSPVLAQKGIR